MVLSKQKLPYQLFFYSGKLTKLPDRYKLVFVFTEMFSYLLQ